MSDKQDRGIFPYHNGETDIHADPTAIYRKLVRALNGDMSGAFELAQPKLQGDGTELPPDMLRRLDGEEALIGAARQAFSLAPFDQITGKGVTDGQALEVLYAWADHLEGNVEKAAS